MVDFIKIFLFPGQTVFLHISADFVTGFEKLFFVAQMVREINAKNISFKKTFKSNDLSPALNLVEHAHIYIINNT